MSKDYTNPPRKPNWEEYAESAMDVADKVTSALSVVGSAVYAEELGDGELQPGRDPNEFVKRRENYSKILRRT